MSADPTDPIAAIRARLEQLDEEIATRVEERERVERALAMLTGSESSVTIHNNMASMEQVSKLRRSAGANKGRDPLAKAANARMLTMADVARKTGVTPGYLSMVRSGKRTIDKALAAKIETLTGFAATPRNWPTLRDE